MYKFTLVMRDARIPDLDGAVLTSRIQKLSLFLESNRCYVRFVRGKVAHLQMQSVGMEEGSARDAQGLATGGTKAKRKFAITYRVGIIGGQLKEFNVWVTSSSEVLLVWSDLKLVGLL